MQKTKTIQIGSRSFTVRELPVRVIWDLINSGDVKVGGVERMKTMLQLGCPDLNEDVLLDLYPSEIEELWQAFEEVNAAFLGIVRRVGLDQVIITAVREAITGSMKQFALSSTPGTVQ